MFNRLNRFCLVLLLSILSLLALPAAAVPPMIAGGFTHSLYLKADGTVWTLGGNRAGQLGDGSTTNRLSPVVVPGLTGVVAIAVAGGPWRGAQCGRLSADR